jgi:inhibitor of cysteine peptidase
VAVQMLTEQDDGRRLSAQLGDEIEIRLSENATAGYRWAPETHDPERLELVEAAANYPSTATGSAGVARFRLRVIAAGTTRLALSYAREWETGVAPLKRFAVTIETAGA